VWRDGGGLQKLSGGHGRGGGEEEEEEEKKGERTEVEENMWRRELRKELLLRWCNPHLLRGRIVIASRERDRETGA